MVEATWDRGEKEFDAQVAEQKAYLDAIYDVAKGSIDRSRDGAKAVQAAAAAIGAIYTGVLGLVFSVTGKALPPRGLLTPLFLGLAIVLTSLYTSYITSVTTGTTYPSLQLDGWLEDSQRRVTAFIRYSKVVVERRAFALRASVAALAASLLFIAAPFVSFAGTQSKPSVVDATHIASVVPAYPTPSGSLPPTRLQEIYYQAQVDEVAIVRKAELDALASPSTPGWSTQDGWWFAGAAIALILGWIVSGALGRAPD